jgi:hypothetical protein
MCLVPQGPTGVDPVIGVRGDIFVNNTNGRLRVNDGVGGVIGAGVAGYRRYRCSLHVFDGAPEVVSGTATETSYAGSAFSIPANDLRQGDILDIYSALVAAGVTGANTVNVRILYGATGAPPSGDILFDSGAINPNVNDLFFLNARIVIKAEPSGASTIVCNALWSFDAPDTAGVMRHQRVVMTPATNATKSLFISAEWSTTSGGNSMNLTEYELEAA